MKHVVRLGCFLLLLSGCAGREAPAQTSIVSERPAIKAERYEEKLSRILTKAEIPPDMAGRITENAAAESGRFFAEMEAILAGDDPFLRLLVDKRHSLPDNYEPGDLAELRYRSYRAGIADTMMLRRKAEAALEALSEAAQKEGITLIVSSAYRSWQYQVGSFDRWTKRLGLKEAERVSARPGRSQHQLGLVVDFGSISNDFASSAAGKWAAANAGRFGWSLSYPNGYEAVTGYAWESWHFRYVGTELAAFIDAWFGGIQQYALRFIHEWEADL